MTPDEVKVSTHALQRFRERFNPKATVEDVARAVAGAQPAPSWVKRLGKWTEDNVLLANGPAVFVTLAPANGGTKTTVITCFPLEWAETNRKSFGKKRLKKKFNVPKQWKGIVR